MRVSTSLLAMLSLLALGIAGRVRAELAIAGPTMGTTFLVRVAQPPPDLNRRLLQGEVAGVLERVDVRMSTWRDDSELERFNRQRDTRWWPVSQETAHVAWAARELAARSKGAFDPTLGPLSRLWGFGRDASASASPSAKALLAAQEASGFRRFHVRKNPPALRKDHPDLELDLSAIAKGHAVDALAERLRELGLANFLIEVGGEIRTRGHASRGGAWIVEVEHPYSAEHPPVRVRLRERAIATSGSYRNFVVRDGVRRSHVLDPRTGTPIEGDLVAVSVIARETLAADGWATALLAAGAEDGWQMAEREKLAALFVSTRDGHWRSRATPSFDIWRSDRGPSREETRP